MLIAFRLSMPYAKSHNGRWSGEGKSYVLVRSFRIPQPALVKGYFTHRFHDGWVAAVTTSEIDKGEAARLRKKSIGFCGYNWMVDSIVRHGEIRTTSTEACR